MSDTDGDRQAIGHNTIAGGQLKSLIERIERLDEEKKAVAEQVKEVFAEAKGNGFDTKTMRTILRLRKKTAEERAEEEAMLDLYLHALGMQPDLPGIDTPAAEMRGAIEGLTAAGAVEVTAGGSPTRIERTDGKIDVTVDGRTSRMTATEAGEAIGAAMRRKLGGARKRSGKRKAAGE